MVDPHPNLIEEWRLNNEEVVLLIDDNENVYKGQFAKALARKGVKLGSAYNRVHKKSCRLPTSVAQRLSWMLLSRQESAASKASSAATS